MRGCQDSGQQIEEALHSLVPTDPEYSLEFAHALEGYLGKQYLGFEPAVVPTRPSGS
jgi:hypothetical protein